MEVKYLISINKEVDEVSFSCLYLFMLVIFSYLFYLYFI